MSRILRRLLDDDLYLRALAHLGICKRDASSMIDLVDPHLVFPILVIAAFIFWAVLATIVDKAIDIIERKRNPK